LNIARQRATQKEYQKTPMNQMIVENIVSWFLFALASTCILSFASTIYDDFINRKRRARDTRAITKIVPLSDPPLDKSAPEGPRGYDSPELFREDLWIRRIEQSRREHAKMAKSLLQLKANGVGGDYRKQLCTMLAHHKGTGCDN
jgi:hypothetical protein